MRFLEKLATVLVSTPRLTIYIMFNVHVNSETYYMSDI